VERVKAALDMGARFNVPISVLWPATDGNDFALQSDYMALYERYVESCRRILEHLHANQYATKVCIEPKSFEPRGHIMMGTTAQALVIVNEIDDPNFGINLDIGHSLIANENVEDQLSLICRYGRLYHTHFDDNDQQCDLDLPPGTVNFIRLAAIMYVLDQNAYDGWFGLDLFPYRDPPRKFIELARDNLRLAARVVELLNEQGAAEMRAAGTFGTEMATLVRDCIGKALA
jgi:xylose isomerase